MSNTFKGGFHPPANKQFSENEAIEIMKPPKIVAIHLSQHIGAPSKSIVKIGDLVKMGQKISEPGGFVSIPVHSSVSGKVKAIAKITDASGRKSDAVVIENDGLDTPIEEMGKSCEDWGKLSNEEIKKKILDSGVAGMGGARFPTHVKLSPPPDKKIDFVILNGVECEPYLTCDDRLMQETPETILEGLKIMMRVVGAENGIVGIEKNKPKSIKVIREKLSSVSNIKVVELEVKYPQGGEKQLIYAATGREVISGTLPMEAGCVVSNVGTANSVYEAVVLNKPYYERVLTVTGDSINSPKNLKVRIGTTVSVLIEKAGGLKKDIVKVISGGPMMGAALFDLETSVHKGMSGILCLGEKSTEAFEEQPCISCGKCVSVCPMNLLPSLIAKYVEYDNVEEADKLNLSDCMLCGTCSYVCPSKRNLVHYFNEGKTKINELRRKNKG